MLNNKYFKMKNSISIIAVLFIFSCTQKVNTEYIDVVAMRASNIYFADSVKEYINKYENSNKDIANSYILKAKETENQNIDKAVYYAKRAVSLNPTYDNYLLLADYLKKKENYQELIQLYALLTDKNIKTETKNEYDYLFSKPNEDVIYQSIVAYINAYNSVFSDTYYYAEELGIDIKQFKERLKNDPSIKMDKSSEAFQLVLLQFVPYDELAQYAQQKNVFADFLKKIPERKINFTIDEQTISEFDYFESRNFDEMSIPISAIDQYYLEEKQTTPNNWYSFNYLYKYTLAPEIIALEYAIDSSETACPKEMRHIYRKIVTYNTNTLKIIDSKLIAYQSGNELATASAENDLITITIQKRAFKKPYDKSDFDNELIGSEKISQVQYRLSKEGKFIEL